MISLCWYTTYLADMPDAEGDTYAPSRYGETVLWAGDMR